jgi:hypothetical protein
MIKILFLFLFLGCSISGFSQYGRLEPLRPNDTTRYVLRTPQETLIKLAQDPDKGIRTVSTKIIAVEKQLNNFRYAYTSNRLPTPDMRSFINTVKYLDSKGINVNYYMEEMFIYFPKR